MFKITDVSKKKNFIFEKEYSEMKRNETSYYKLYDWNKGISYILMYFDINYLQK